MLGVFGPKLAMLALCWPYVGFILALILWGSFFLEKKKEPRPLGLTRGSFSIFHPPCHDFFAEMHLPTFKVRSIRNATLKAIAFYLARMAGGAQGRTVSGSQSG